MKRVILCIYCVFFSHPFLEAQDRITGEPFATRSEVLGQNGMVATSHPLATKFNI